MNKPLWGKKPAQFADTEPASTVPLPMGNEADFDAPTEPMPLSPAKAKPAKPNVADIPELSLSLAPQEAGEYELMAELRKENRVCPQPTRWLEFYRVLQDAAGAGKQLPSPPLTGSAWAATPPSAKRMCFREQAEWAVQNGCVAQAYDFLEKLPKTDWLYAD